MRTLTPDQIRAARGLLDWSQKFLGQKAGVSKDLISKIEKGTLDGSLRTHKAIFQAFDRAGLEFTEGEGVRKKQVYARQYTGRKEFCSFFDDVYTTIKEEGGDICVSNVNEEKFVYWLGEEKAAEHRNRMETLSNYRLRALVREKEESLYKNIERYSYAEFRTVPDNLYAETPLYIYSKKLALIIFEEKTINVFVFAHDKLTESQLLQFEVIWKNAKQITD